METQIVDRNLSLGERTEEEIVAKVRRIDEVPFLTMADPM
jgi:hypothetical protein